MRYDRGGIELNGTEDDSILRQVMLSRYISHEQLWRLVLLRNSLAPRSTFNWRMDRLAKHGLVRKEKGSLFGRNIIYSLERPALEYLAGRGECVADFDWRTRRSEEAGTGAIFHSLELNSMYLRLQETGTVFGWRWETEIRAHNELTGVPYTKDYDAIVSLHVSGREAKFALEYERMAKSSHRYAGIRKAIEAERQVDVFLYLAAHYKVMSFVLRHFTNSRRRVYFGLLSDFTDKTWDMDVVDSRQLSKRLREVLIPSAQQV